MGLRKIIRRDDLEVMVFSDEKQAGIAAAAEGSRQIAEVMRRKETCTIIFAAAVSQHEMLTALSEDEGIDWSRIRAFHMDEYIGLSGNDPRTLAHFFTLYPKIRPGRFYFLKPDAGNAAEECARYEKLLKEEPIDIVFCGVGDNGHLAFNEPHAAMFDDTVWVKTVEIDTVSRQQQVNAGNFPEVALVPPTAYTLTIPALIAGECMLCIAPTSFKADAVANMLEQPVSEKCPASILRRHKNAKLFLDPDSGSAVLGRQSQIP